MDAGGSGLAGMNVDTADGRAAPPPPPAERRVRRGGNLPAAQAGGSASGRDDYPRHATMGDILQAIEGLTLEDYGRLFAAAGRSLRATSFASAKDRVIDVIGAAFIAAHDGKGRRWRTDTDFRAFLHMSMKGISSDLRRSEKRRLLCLHRPEMATLHAATPTPEQILAEEEGRCAACEQEVLEKLRAHFMEDERVLWVIKGITEAVPARQIQAQSGMTRTQYETAHRRLRRGLRGLLRTIQRR
jgi:DNA-directed RNA polymerase specialized sigma24 family protein